jgi:membrane-associated phospholipid phosphatase
MTGDQLKTLRIGVVFLVLTLTITRILQIDKIFIDLYTADYFFGRAVNGIFLTFGYSLLIYGIYRRQDRRDFKTVVVSCVSGLVIVQLLKWVTGHEFPRPSTAYGGFPSGHAQASFALAYMIGRRYPKLTIPAYAMAGIITWSRVPYQHYFYQIAAGGIFGLAIPVLVERWNEGRSSGSPQAHAKEAL